MSITGPTPPTLPDDLVYSLPSIVEPLALEDLFSTPQPCEVELGSGDGSFLLAYAQLHPGRNFIGVERLMGRVKKLDRKGRRLGLANLRGIRIESRYLLQYLLPSHCAEAIHVYFPDPWPKKKHHKNRIINQEFPALAQRVLRANGAVHLRTDDLDYFQQMVEVFAQASGFGRMTTPEELARIKTDFEQDFAAEGKATHSASFRSNP